MAPDRDSFEPDADSVAPGPEPDDGHSHSDPDDDLDVDFGEDELPGFAEDAEDAEDGSQTPPAVKVESWRKRSATGAVLTGIALGLQQVFEKEREEPAIIMTTSGDPPRDLPVEADVEHGRPRRSVVNIRPWLLDRPGGASGAEQTTGTPDPAGAGAGIDATTGTGAAADDRASGDDEPPTASSPEGD